MNTPSNISNTFTNCRNLQTYNGNLYVSASTGAFKGVSQVGSGIPTTGGQAEVLLATEASANGPYGFSISPDGNTMYVGSSSVGIMKYTRTGASGPFTVAGYTIYTTPCSGIAVDYTNSVTPTIYATTSAGTSLIKIQDAGSTSASLLTLSTLATTPSTNAFRGVMFAPASYATISGNAAICAGASTNITFNGNPHGTVTYNINGGTNQTIVLDSAKASASIGTGTLTAGNYTYSLVSITTPAGTATVSGSVVVTVNPLPSVITGTTNICVAASTALTDVDAGGTWSNTNTNASVIGSTGVITGQGPGLDTIIYTLPTGCAANITVTINAVPTITSANNGGPLCTGATLNLSVTGASNVTGYAWSGPVAITSPTSASASVPLVTASANGIYTVTLNNGTGIGCTAAYTTAAVTVNTVPSSTGATNSSPICNGGTVTLNDNSSNATAWSWVGSDGFSSSLQSPTATPTVNVTYSLTVSSTGAGCNPSAVYTTIVTVNAVPSSSGVTNDGPICNGGTVNLSAHSSNATAWSWVGSDGFTSSLQNPAATPTVNVTYSLTLSSAGNGCNPSLVYTTNVTVNTVPSSTGATNSSPICNGGTVTLNDHSTNATAWSWVGSDGFTSSLQNPTATPTVNVTYSLTVSSTGNGCNPSAVYTTIVTVNAVPSSSGVTNDGPICKGGTVNLSAHSSNATGWSWVGSDGFTSSLQNPTATPTVNATYSLTVSSAGNGCNPSAVHTTIVTVNVVPSSTGVTNSSPICSGGTVTLSAHSSNATAWSWVGSDGFTSSLQNPMATPTVNVTYSLTVSSAGNGCNPSSVYATIVTVNPAPFSTGPTNSGPICNGGTVTLNDNSANATGWSWVGSDGFTSTLQSPTATPTTTTTYSLTVSGSGTTCASTTTYTTTVAVNLVPSSTGATNSSPICNGGSVTLTAHSSNATAWSWVGSDGFTSSLQNPIATPTVNVTYSLTVSSTGSGCSPSAVHTTIVTVNPVPSSTGATNSSPICNGGNVTLSAHSTNATAWSWVGSDGFTSSLQNPTATPTVNATYSLTVSSSGNGCNPSTPYTTIVTVNAAPSSTGVNNDGPICNGGTVNLSAHSSNATAWSWVGSDGFTSSLQNPTATPTVNATYSLTMSSTGNGCNPPAFYTTIVTVNAVPSSTGATNDGPICNGGTVNLSAHSSNATAWSWIGSDGFTSSLQNPTATPTVNVTYSLTVSSTGNGCSPSAIHTTIITVNAVPSSTGATNSSPICNGGMVTLSAHSSNATAWSWVGSDGFTSSLQNPTATPTVNVTYSLTVSSAGNGCNPSTVYTTIVTVNAAPSSTGATNSSPICNGGTVTLSDHSSNATAWSWVGSDGYTSTLQSPAATPTTTTTYSLTMSSTGNGCSSPVYITVVTVNTVPSSTGATNSSPICNGGAVTLSAHSSNATAWSWVGSDGFTSSLQNPTATPTVNVTYSLTVSSTGNGCNPSTVYTTIVTVNAVPSSTGATNSSPVCNGGAVTLSAHSSNATAWSWIGSDGFTSSLQNPTATPTVNATYSLTVSSTGKGCNPSTVDATIVTVNAAPSSTGATNDGPICNGGTLNLSAHSSNATAWSWVGSDGFTSSQQNPTATPTVNVTYSLTVSSIGNGCSPSTIHTTIVTVNAVPSSTGTTNSGAICNGGTVTLSAHSSNATAWSWVGSDGFTSSQQNPTATPTVNATYSLTVSSTGNGCNPSSVYTTAVTVNTVPSSTGATNSSPICNGGNVILSDNSSNATAWSWVGSDGFTSSLQSPVATPTITTTYSLTVSSTGNGCSPSTVYATIVTVNPLPDAISGSGTVSVGFGTTLSDDISLGTWSSNNGNVTIGSSSGSVSGVTAGTSVITYMLATGCYVTTIMTINAVPPVITGTLTVCVGSGVTLSDAAVGGTWTSGNGNVTIGSSSGAVSGVTAGTSVITYTFPTTGFVTAIVTVNPLPSAILGVGTVCNGSAITLSNTTSGVAWSGSNANATVGGLSGIVTGTNAGTVTITCYILATGCSVQTVVTVNALPDAITGTSQVCLGLQTTLSDAGGGTWTSSNGNATIGSVTGTVTGAIAGTSVITYTLPVTGCTDTAIVTVNPLPGNISGAGHVCAGLAITLSDAGSGSWTSSNAHATVALLSGTVTGATAGTSIITYTLPTTCITTTVVTVDPIVVPGVTLDPATGDTVCSGTTVLFTATPVNGGTTPVYQWKVNTTVTAATSNTYSYEPANGDIVHVLLTSNATCATPVTATVADTMTVIHTDPTSVHISVTPNDTVCLGSTVVFTALGTNSGPSPVYIWSRNGATVASGLVYGYVPANNDNVYCSMVSSLRCKTADTAASNHIVMTVDTAYIPSVEVIVTPGTSIQPGEADTFRAVVSNGGPLISYQWILNTTVLAGATNEMYYGSGFGNSDSMTCVVTSAGPCGYASFNTVKIHVIATGVQQYATGMGDVRLIPNPNKGQFAIKGSLGTGADEEANIEITDMLGQMVYRNKIMTQNGVINEAISLSNTLANGMYMLNLHTANERKVIHFVIEQ